MALELTSITVRIYGWDYTLKVEPSQVERAKALAEYMDHRMQQMAGRSGTADSLKIAIRSALTIIDELFNAQEKLEGVAKNPVAAVPVAEGSHDFRKKVDELSSRIDAELQSFELI